MASDGPSADYSSASGGKYFGWSNVSRFTPSRLAVRFIERFPDIAERIGSSKTGGDTYMDFTGTEWKK